MIEGIAGLAIAQATAPEAIAPERWVSDADYPPEARRANQEGRVKVDLVIDAVGRVTGCSVSRSSGFASLDAATCTAASARGRFRPAMDSNGTATGGTSSLTFAWTITAEPRHPLTNSSASIIRRMTGAGEVLDCAETGEIALLEGFQCTATWSFPPDVFTAMRSGRSSDFTLRGQAWRVVDGPEPLVPRPDGHVALVDRTMRMRVPASGYSETCEIVHDEGLSRARTCTSVPFVQRSADLPTVNVTIGSAFWIVEDGGSR